MNGNKEGRNRRKTGRSQKKKEKGVAIRIRRKNQVKPGQGTLTQVRNRGQKGAQNVRECRCGGWLRVRRHPIGSISLSVHSIYLLDQFVNQ